MKPRLLIILSFSLAGCATNATNITWDKIPVADIGHKCTMTSGHSAYGCAQQDKEKSWCRIYTPNAEGLQSIIERDNRFKGLTPVQLEMLILGHETKHCFDGNFHK